MIGKQRFRSKRSIGLTVLALLAAGPWVGTWTPAAQAQGDTCFGRAVTIQAGSGETAGTEGNDVIAAGGSSIVDGKGGDDRICISGGSSQAYGGTGDDRIAIDGSSSVGEGGVGDDQLYVTGSSGNLFGNEGNDVLSAGEGSSAGLDGGPERDKCYGTGSSATFVECEEINPQDGGGYGTINQ